MVLTMHTYVCCNHHHSVNNHENRTMTTNKSKNASREDWHPARILMELRLVGITLSAIAEANGLSDSTSLSAAMVRSYPKNEQRIADALNVHPKVIWPSRYNEDGTRKPRGIRAVQFNAVARVRNGKLAQAA